MSRLGILDFARGLAALFVCASHLRNFVFVDFNQAGNVGVGWKIFYAVTGFGHAAVIVFFVLSGFLIGDHVAQAMRGGRWSWRDYAVRRLTRLWIVLIPALVITAVLDQAGMRIASDFYFGRLNDVFHSGPRSIDVPGGYGVATFLANLSFLQTITAPTFGTNGPLWSLANEFWYYVMFPLGFIAVDRSRSTLARSIGLLLAAGLAMILPEDLVIAGGIWLLGYIAAEINRTMRPGVITLLAAAAAFGAFIVALGIARILKEGMLIDYLVGACFAVFLIFGARFNVRSAPMKHLAKAISESSYTLYLVHFPFLAFVAVALLKGERFAPSATGVAVYIGLFAAVLAFSTLVYWFFERHTARVQSYLLRRMPTGKSPSPQSAA